jgi:hypothetical protein
MDSYFKYLIALEAINKKIKLSNDERLLLDVVATATHNDKVIYVKDLITLHKIA